MPQLPTVGDWYLVLPFVEGQSEEDPVDVMSVQQSFLIQAARSEDAAQRAFDFGYPICGVILVEYFKETSQ